MVERALEANPDWVDNDLAPWDYHAVPAALGCRGWFTAKVTTLGELDAALAGPRRANRRATSMWSQGGWRCRRNSPWPTSASTPCTRMARAPKVCGRSSKHREQTTRRTSVNYFGQYEDEIYAAGLRGVVHKLPIDIATLEKKAVAAWPQTIASYVQCGCGDERTQDLNVAAFRKWGLVPRMMVDGSKRNMSIELFGMKLPTPLFMAPIGVIGICAQ